MLKLRRAGFLAMAAICHLSAANDEPPPVAAFASLPDVEGITISPTGRYLTASIRQGESAAFQIITHPGREMKVNVALGDKREVTQVVWLTDEVALFQQALRVMGTDYRVPTGALATVHAETGFVQLAGGGSVIDMLPDQPDHILVHYPRVSYTDPSHPLAGHHASLAKMFEGDTVQLVSATRDRRLAIALVTGDRRPGDYFLVDTESRKVELLKRRKPDLKPEGLSQTSPIELQVRDGTTIYGYVTSSPKAEKPGPMVVYVHGGPHGIRDYWGYDDTVQLLASRGFHVLQVNFRGSGGYGVDYARAGYGEWGRRMQDDVTDATRWAVQNGIADPSRVCIFGASYGAYSAMMGTIREPGLYRCALGMHGIYDLTLMQKQGDISRTRAGERFIRRILRADENDLIATSPLHQADRIHAKVMLVHGGLDERAPPEHATRLHKALVRAGNEPEWLFDRQQGHGFLGDAARVDLFQRMLAFFLEHTRNEDPSSTKDGEPVSDS